MRNLFVAVFTITLSVGGWSGSLANGSEVDESCQKKKCKKDGWYLITSGKQDSIAKNPILTVEDFAEIKLDSVNTLMPDAIISPPSTLMKIAKGVDSAPDFVKKESHKKWKKMEESWKSSSVNLSSNSANYMTTEAYKDFRNYILTGKRGSIYLYAYHHRRRTKPFQHEGKCQSRYLGCKSITGVWRKSV